MSARLKEWVGRLILMSLSFLFAFVLAEIVTRFVYPISDGRENVTLSGNKITGWLEANTVYRQVSNEYDALTTITDKGHRVPAVDGNPDVVFIGDSFTFGWGVSDDETFVSIFCTRMKYSCANLGEPGTGTSRQLDNLERFLDDWFWRPREVKLFVFAMTASFSSGNDLADNFSYGRRNLAQSDDASEVREDAKPGLIERMIGLQDVFLQHSNLIRMVKYHWGPLLRSTFVPRLEKSRLEVALAFTETELFRLNNLGDKYGFTYSIYLIHPVQDIIRDTYTNTLATLSQISPSLVHDTAPLFLDSPERFYYSYDGHLNNVGTRQIGEFLISQESDERVSGSGVSH